MRHGPRQGPVRNGRRLDRRTAGVIKYFQYSMYYEVNLAGSGAWRASGRGGRGRSGGDGDVDLSLSEDQLSVRSVCAEFFDKEATLERVRAAEPLGFDPDLCGRLAGTGGVAMGPPLEAGGAGRPTPSASTPPCGPGWPGPASSPWPCPRRRAAVWPARWTPGWWPSSLA